MLLDVNSLPRQRQTEALAARRGADWRGPVLVSLSCFTLVWQAWLVVQPPRQLVIEHRGVIKRYAIPDDAAGFDSLCQTLRRQHPPAVAGVTGLVRWRGEVAAMYAAAEARDRAAEDQRQASEVADQPVVRLASSVVPANDASPSESPWQAYWLAQSDEAVKWVDERDAGYEKRLMALAESAYLSRHQTARPPVALWTLAGLAAMVTFVVTRQWQAWQPNRQWPDTSMECQFETDWFAISQPWGVRLRAAMGSSLVLAAVVLVSWRWVSG